MKCNVGGIDRILRISVGIVLVVLATNGIVGWWAWLGLIPMATGIFRFCPAYLLIGINSCGTSSQEDSCYK